MNWKLSERMYKNSKVHDTHRKYTHNSAQQLKENSTVYDTPWCFLTFLPIINYSFTSKLLEINLWEATEGICLGLH